MPTYESYPNPDHAPCQFSGVVRAKNWYWWLEPVDLENEPERQQEERRDFSFTEEQEAMAVDAIREAPAIWRCGHCQYKERRKFLAAIAGTLGVPTANLEGWWKGVRDWFVRLSRKKSGQAAKPLTDREQWIVQNIKFFMPQARASEGAGQPMASLPLTTTTTTTQADSDVSEVEVEAAAEMAAEVDDLEGLEENAARAASAPGPAAPRPKKRHCLDLDPEMTSRPGWSGPLKQIQPSY